MNAPLSNNLLREIDEVSIPEETPSFACSESYNLQEKIEQRLQIINPLKSVEKPEESSTQSCEEISLPEEILSKDSKTPDASRKESTAYNWQKKFNRIAYSKATPLVVSSAVFVGLADYMLAKDVILNQFLADHTWGLLMWKDGHVLWKELFFTKNYLIYPTYLIALGYIYQYIYRYLAFQKNPYCIQISECYRLEWKPGSNSGEIHFHANNTLYRAAQKNRSIVVIRMIRDLKQLVIDFTGGNIPTSKSDPTPIETLSLHSAIFNQKNISLVEHILKECSGENVSYSQELAELPWYQHYASINIGENRPIPFIGKLEKYIWKQIPLSHDWITNWADPHAVLDSNMRTTVVGILSLFSGWFIGIRNFLHTKFPKYISPSAWENSQYYKVVLQRKDIV